MQRFLILILIFTQVILCELKIALKKQIINKYYNFLNKTLGVAYTLRLCLSNGIF